MDRNQHMSELFDQALGGKLSRRTVLRRALALGLSVPAISTLLAACGSSDKKTATSGTGSTGTGSPTKSSAPATTSAGGSPTKASSPSASGSPTKSSSPTAGASPTKSSSPTAGGSPTKAGSPSTGGAYKYTKDNPPPVPNAADAKQYSGTKIVFWGDAVGPGAEMDTILATQFTKDTGIDVQVVPRPTSSDESFSQYQRTFQGQSSDMDCGMIDVVWPGALAPHLVDLTDAISADMTDFYDTIIQNNTIDGKLVGIPWFGDFGMLYYRTDLMEKYGYSAPPETWDELEEQAQKIMEGETGANPNFTGFVFQGNAYEGLTCNALEWLNSQGGGTIVDENNEVTLDTDPAKAALTRAQKWVGGIAPAGVTGYQEDQTLNAFQTGNAAFARNWPYMYSSNQSDASAVKGKFDVAPLPAQSGSDHSGTVGGWQIAVSNYSKNKEAAIEYAKYITSAEVQKFRAIITSFVPTRASVSEDADVLKALPFLETLADVVRVTRPSRAAGENYNELSTDFFQGCNQILTGSSPDDIVPDMVSSIQDLLQS
jgi:trehalose/maltose transport system substrate-binding protein